MKSGFRVRVRETTYALLGATLMWITACEADTSWTSGDHVALSISPSKVYLAPVGATTANTGEGTATGNTSLASNPLPTSQVLTAYGAGDDGKPAEGTHITVCAGSDCEGAPSATHPVATASEFLQLSAAVAGVTTSACAQISATLLNCVLGVDGAARFTLASISSVDSNVAIDLTARAGSQATYNAQVFVGRPLAGNSALNIADIKSGTLMEAARPICAAAQSPSCESLVRVSSASVQIVAQPGSDGANTSGLVPLQGSAVDVDISIAQTPGSDTGGTAWLSKSNTCDNKSGSRIATVTDPSTGSANFFVCTNGLAGSFDIAAIAGSLDAPVTTSKPTTFEFDAVVADVLATIETCTNGNAAGNVIVRLEDCSGKPVSATNLSWNVDGTTARATLPVAADGTACIKVPAATGADQTTASAVSLDFSTCSGPLSIGTL